MTHRLMVIASGDAAAPSAWPLAAHHARAAAEPHVNAWVGGLLGSPASFGCVVEYLSAADGSAIATEEIGLDALDLAPLDVLYLSHGASTTGESELERRFRYYVTRHWPADVPADAQTRVSFGRDYSGARTRIAAGDLLEIAHGLREAMVAARPLGASDLAVPEDKVDEGLDTGAFALRVDAAKTALSDAVARLEAASAAEDLRAALLALSYFGIADAVPVSAAGDGDEERTALAEQATVVAAIVARRLEDAAELEDGVDRAAAGARVLCDHDRARLRLLFGGAFQAAPAFTIANAADVQSSLDNSDVLLHGDAGAPAAWLARAACVRERAGALDRALLFAQACGSLSALPRVVQLPFDAAERWVGLDLGASPAGGRVSLVAIPATDLDPAQPLWGLLLDEWVEVVPGSSEITGVAFHVDEPGARAPNAMLLAVPPNATTAWDLETLEAILQETLDLAKIRAVDAEVLSGVGHLIPGLFFADNVKGEAVSIDVLRAATSG